MAFAAWKLGSSSLYTHFGGPPSHLLHYRYIQSNTSTLEIFKSVAWTESFSAWLIVNLRTASSPRCQGIGANLAIPMRPWMLTVHVTGGIHGWLHTLPRLHPSPTV